MTHCWTEKSWKCYRNNLEHLKEETYGLLGPLVIEMDTSLINAIGFDLTTARAIDLKSLIEMDLATVRVIGLEIVLEIDLATARVIGLKCATEICLAIARKSAKV
mmetsp:Transcript_25493/g.29413  ORF Transcript_25493/g.29413 Transcript_25493/m.29413 type:complete len:105 (-) Transcript_25493:21-335(-)